MGLGYKLKVLREQRQLSQRDLAKVLNIAPSTLAMYELDKREPDFAILNKIADFFGVSTDFLLDRTTIPHVELKEGIVLKDGEPIKPEYISDECALEAARVIAKDGAVLNREEKSFLLNMIKAYIAAAENEKRKNSGKKAK